MPLDKTHVQRILHYTQYNWPKSHEKTPEAVVGYLIGTDTTLVAPMESFINEDGSYNSVVYRFSIFIYLRHGIHHIDLTAQIGCYAHRQNIPWLRAFYQLFVEFFKTFPEDSHDPRYQPFSSYGPHCAYPPDPFDKVTINFTPLEYIEVDNQVIKVGDVISLSDLINKDYEKTALFDKTLIDPDWSLFLPSEKDYQSVRFAMLYVPQDQKPDRVLRRGRLRRIMRGYEDTITHILKRNGRPFAFTRFLEIDLQAAFEHAEIEIMSEKVRDTKTIDELLESALFAMTFHEQGLITHEEAMRPIYEFRLCQELIDWSNYRFTFGSSWIPIDKSKT